MMSRRKAILAVLATVAVAVLVLACRPVVHTVVSGPFTIRYWQASSQRIDRTTFEYTFQGEIETTGPVETGVKARVASSDPNTTTTDAFLTFPGAAPGTVVASFDTFTIRQTRTSAFTPAQLQWTVTGIAIPPDPGPANDATIAGIDTNGNEVRDDVERFIALRIPESERHQAVLREDAIAMQRFLAATNRAEAVAAGTLGDLAMQCLDYIEDSALNGSRTNQWKEVKALMYNTQERLVALDNYNDLVTGTIFHGVQYGQKRSACGFNVEALPN